MEGALAFSQFGCLVQIVLESSFIALGFFLLFLMLRYVGCA